MVVVGGKVFVSGLFGSKEGVVLKRLGSEKVLVKFFDSQKVKAVDVSDLEEV